MAITQPIGNRIKYSKPKLPNALFSAVTNQAKNNILSLNDELFLVHFGELTKRAPNMMLGENDSVEVLRTRVGSLFDCWWGLKPAVWFDSFEIAACAHGAIEYCYHSV